jgi:hypothetical protein
MANSKRFLTSTVQRVDQDLLTSDCNLRFEEKIKLQNQEKGDIESLTRRVESLAEQIRATRTYDGLRIAMRQHVLEQENAILNEFEEQADLASLFLPLLKVPTSPGGVIKFVKNFVLKNIQPQASAIIRFVKRSIALSIALSELAVEVSLAVNYLDDYVKNVDRERRRETKASLQRISFAVQAEIQNEISKQICDDFKEQGITANDVTSYYEALNDLRQLQNEIGIAQGAVRTVLDNNLETVRDLQNGLSTLTGVPPGMDTTDVDTFINSIVSGDADAYLNDVNTVSTQAPPKNIIPPQIIFQANSAPVTNTVIVLTPLTVTEGTWENDIEETYFQWFADDELVANTQNYIPDANTIGKTLVAAVIKENFSSETEARSPVISNVTNPYTFVSNIIQPSITGSVQVGQTITCSTGVWNGTSPITYSYQWEYAKTGEVLLGETSNQYLIDNEDRNRTLRCKVTATNLLGSNTIYSITTAGVTT